MIIYEFEVVCPFGNALSEIIKLPASDFSGSPGAIESGDLPCICLNVVDPSNLKRDWEKERWAKLISILMNDDIEPGTTVNILDQNPFLHTSLYLLIESVEEGNLPLLPDHI